MKCVFTIDCSFGDYECQCHDMKVYPIEYKDETHLYVDLVDKIKEQQNKIEEHYKTCRELIKKKYDNSAKNTKMKEIRAIVKEELPPEPENYIMFDRYQILVRDVKPDDIKAYTLEEWFEKHDPE